MPLDDRDVLIRKVRSSDLDELSALDVTFGDLTYPYFVLRQLFDVHQHCWLVADHPNGILGYALGAPGLDRETGWLLGHVVGSEYRRRGYGRLLALSSLQILRSVGVRRVYLTAKPANKIAINLYETIGFTVRSLRENYLGPGEDRFLMELDL
jgi:ribosomal protein S18 acetylase RimI-like enzyme